MEYKHLNYEQRYTIECMLKNGHKKKDIYKAISVSESTLYRELSRNKQKRGGYNAKYAQMLADERLKEGHYKRKFTSAMQKIVDEKIKMDWSPEQITNWCKHQAIDMVSHERIYQYIWADKQQGGGLYKHLRTGAKKYKKRYGSKTSRGQIPDKISIDKRPEIVDEKSRIGDFEIDLIVGKNHKGALLTIVDRKSCFLIVENTHGKKADIVAKKIINALAPYKAWVKTITNDNGKEFALHKKVAEKLQCDVFFAHPYCSWERGLNEYTNKLLRQYFPKNQSIKNIDAKYLNHVVELINNRPRKKLGYRTPKEVFYQYIYNQQKLALSG